MSLIKTLASSMKKAQKSSIVKATRKQPSIKQKTTQINVGLHIQKPTANQKATVIKKLRAKCYGIDAYLDRMERTFPYHNRENTFIESDFIAQVFPNLDNTHCPTCHHSFDNPLRRGRECPSCGEKLRVSNYKILDKQHDEALEEYKAQWLALFDAKRIRREIDTEFEYGNLMTVIGKMAEFYQALNDFDSAWQCFSDTDPNVPVSMAWLISITEDNENGGVNPNDMVAIENWRAGFLDQRFKNHEWKVDAKWVIEMYINVIKKALSFHIPSDYGCVANAVTKLTVYIDTGYIRIIEELLPNQPPEVQSILSKVIR